MSMRFARVALTFVLQGLLRCASSDKDIKSPPTVLLDDDPCLSDSTSQQFHCGTALLQSGNRRVPLRKASSVTVKSSSEKTRNEEAAGPSLEDLFEVAEKASRNFSFLHELHSFIVPKDKHQRQLMLLQEHLARISACDEHLQLRQTHERKLTELYNHWVHLHKDCETKVLTFKQDLESCQQMRTGAENQSQTAECSEKHRRLHDKMSDCSSMRSAMRSTGCARASQASESCSIYGLCRTSLSSAFLHAKEATKAALAQSGQRQEQWLATLRCLRDRTGEAHFNHTDALAVAKECHHRAQEGALLQDPPAPLECNSRSDEQILCGEEPAASSEHRNLLQDLASQALSADLAREVSGVSFMQEGIERADALPGHLHKVLSDSMFSVPMLLALFTLLMLWLRCTSALQGKEHKEPPSTPSSVDAWCVNGQGSLEVEDGKWLCQELIVPRNSRCSVTVPRMAREGPKTALVTDKMGQCMFKASAVEAGDGLRINLARQDGSVLVSCQISFEGSGSCQILQADASPFASLEWEDSQARTARASWFRWPSAGPGAFVLRSEAGVLLRVTGDLDGKDGQLQVHDARKRPVAAVTACRAAAGPPEKLQIEVISEGVVDLGLVLASLLAVDRLQAQDRALL